MLHLLRIGSRYINLAAAHINLDAVYHNSYHAQAFKGAPPSEPCVRITLIGGLSDDRLGFGCEILEYRGVNYAPVRARLEEGLNALAFAGIDLPDPVEEEDKPFRSAPAGANTVVAQDNDPSGEIVQSFSEPDGPATDNATGLLRGVNARDLGLV